MKTIITLITFSLFTSVALAAKKDPSVTVTSNGEFMIVINGTQYKNDKKISLTDLKKGEYYIDVWKKKKGMFGGKYKLVSSKSFELDKKDVHIDVNSSGYITIGNQEKGWDGDYWYRNKDKKDGGRKGDDNDKSYK